MRSLGGELSIGSRATLKNPKSKTLIPETLNPKPKISLKP